ncbi:MAG: toll/interleukin-1 receptor domain-containing protein [Acidobacteria bacterium]|nr:toll/interleukin-1 receptor domain-containing protein [Acidobacteriota bacterium]
MPPKEVFISHSDLDEKFVSALAGMLRRHNVPVWYSKTNTSGVEDWYDQIGEALNRCDWFVVVMSPNSTRSQWVKRELVFALTEKRYNNRIVPILYLPPQHRKKFDYKRTLFWSLAGMSIKDFRGKRVDGYRELLKTWGIGYKPK